MKKKVAILIPQLSGGGAERVASNLSVHLRDDKYQKYIIVYHTENKDYLFGGELIDLETKVFPNLLHKMKNFYIRFNKMKKLKREHGFETTISLLSTPNILNIFTRNNDKVIVSVRNFVSKSSDGFYGKLFKISIKLLYNRADSIVAVSEAIKNDLVENCGIIEDKIKVIYNPYDIEKISNLMEEDIEDEYKTIFKSPTIVTVGRLSKQKGQWHLIRAFKRVKNLIPDAKLVILGQGDLEVYLKKLCFDLGLEEDVFFLGYKKNPFKYIAKSTLYAFPSLYEGFPNALCEAMACGRPIISADCKSGPREILAPETSINKEAKEIEYEKYGILVPVCDGILYRYDDKLTVQEEYLGDSILGVLKNEELRNHYSSQSLKRVEDFNIKKIIKKWEDEVV